MEYQIYLKDLFTNSKNIKNDEKNKWRSDN